MNFDLSEDEEMLKALAERFVADNYDIERRRSFLAEPHGFSAANWALLGELGLIAAAFDEQAGGMALDATGIATIFEALGRGLVVEPLIENVLLAGRLFAATARGVLRDGWLPGLLTGERRIAFAHAETKARGGHLWIETRADAAGRIDGGKAYVPAGAGCDGYVVSARTAGSPDTADGLGLYFVPAGAAGLSIDEWRMADGSTAASLDFAQVAAERLDGGVSDVAGIEPIADLARSAEALGIMERIFAETTDYLRTRRQFGSALADFQAIQHRMVAQYAAIEQSRGLLNQALVNHGGEGFEHAVRGLRAFIAPASIELGHEMIQFHGGMGVTDELAIGHGHKRLLVLSRWPDDPETALDRFAGIAA
ncbi:MULTISPECIES: acyl-CoA dehydrogenase family protein [unclassified Sphingomonas]|uniref:acyl-CoA dehydrogenase family protein n=1 Tax=unclassified Sphingomonas TaxID=196159 RepID=UPI0006F6F77C|nr:MULTISPECIES: acyl-CoA dehydrogenase family protein [unclassified Sphingomonas]KQX17881.1 acyl-CoA dehydrogenase [Sphingomonas sp. Root1294]KQY71018.1 acyl-CoA dehydrogenase [Sphingomonas sp. Root50]KRB91698.1 acyl-CoA dehydrogenase [Sphingomonas sp. Root720]